jgi:ParB family chromosome partitioning protein
MAKLNIQTTAGFNAGKNFFAKMVRIEDIVIDPEISKIFRISDTIRDEIKQKIKKFGFDKSQPLSLQKGTNILLDGHTRLAAAREAGLEEIPAVEMEIEDREEALLYTFERQALRRNLTGPEIMAAAKMIHGRKEYDGTGRAAELLANKLGVSASTVYQAQAILREAPDEIVQAVENGDMSVKKGYLETKRRQKPEAAFTVTDAKGLPENVAFLRSAVILLTEAGNTNLLITHVSAAELLVNHFLRKNKAEFYQLLPENVRKALVCR